MTTSLRPNILRSMPYYRRWRVEGGTYFFTLVTQFRMVSLVEESSRRFLHEAIEEAQRRSPFCIRAIVLLPDHLHLMIQLPEGDSDYPARLAKIKRNFTQRYLQAGGHEAPVSEPKRRQRYRGVWQARYHEHCIRGYQDFKLHLDYAHSNPVKHGLVQRPKDWRWSTFHSYVKSGEYTLDWCGHITLPGATDIEPEDW